MNFFKSLLSVSGTSGTPKPRRILDEGWVKEITERAEEKQAMTKEITSGDYISVFTKSSGIHLFGDGAYTDYEPRVLYVHFGKSYLRFPRHDVVFVRHVIAGEDIKYVRQ